MFQDDNGLDTKCSMNTGETGTSLELQQAHRNMDFQVKKVLRSWTAEIQGHVKLWGENVTLTFSSKTCGRINHVVQGARSNCANLASCLSRWLRFLR